VKLTTTHIDWLNIALMFLAAGAAYVLPFEVFLFSYAVLGPLHYLTEISWLHERKYFTTGARDAIVLFLLSVVLFFVNVGVPTIWPAPRPDTAPPQVIAQYSATMQQAGATIIYLALMSALAMVVFRSLSSKIAMMLLAGVFLMGMIKLPLWILFFTIFLPTLVHVFVFTAAFMLLGALKNRSVPGLLSFLLLFVIAGLLLFYRPDVYTIVPEGVKSHYHNFVELNGWLANLFGESWNRARIKEVAYQTPLGVALMRFIAFAYTYHYLNWFSKTSIIKWHQVNKFRLVAIVVLWLVAVGLYWWNYQIGFIALYTLSFLHVFLEFPLNWRSFLELGKEFQGIASHGWSRPKMVAA
jgi:hypothetical protein